MTFNNRKNNISYIILGISICIITIILTANTSDSSIPSTKYTKNSRKTESLNISYPKIPNPQTPQYIMFANKKINFDRLDMYERFDRELTSLTFGHSNTLLTIKRANRFFPIIIPILKKYGIPEDFIYLAAIESYFNIRAYSPARAAGIWQFLSSTGKEYGLEINNEVDERYDPVKSTIAACKYLKKAYSRFHNWTTVASSYNAGMGKISKELNSQLVNNSMDLYLTDETSRYVFRIFAMKEILTNPVKYGFNIKSDQLYQPISYKEISVNEPIESWSKWCKKFNISYIQLKELNPWIRKNSLTNKKRHTYKVRIPLKDELYRSKRVYKTYNTNWVID